MRSTCSMFMVFLALALAAPGPVRALEEQAVTAGKEAAGRGEGFEAEAQQAKGVEVPCTFGPIVSDTAVPIGKGKFAVQSTFGWSVVTDVFSRNWARTPAGGDLQSFSMAWKLSYGLIENMEVYVSVPYGHNWLSDADEPGPGGERSANAGNLGDINLTVKYRLVEETETLPNITALFTTNFPSGKFRNLNPANLGTDVAGGGSYVFTPGINVSKYVKPFILYGNLWYSMRTPFTDDDGKQYPGDYVTVNLAAEYPIIDKWVALLELTSTWGGGRLFGPGTNTPTQSLLSVLPGIEYIATEKLSMALGLNIDLIGRNIDAKVGPLLSICYAF